MKKITILFSMFVLILTLGACDQISSVIDEVDPTISGIEDITIAVGSTFNVMDGVTANDDQDGDITSLITYTITDEIGNPVTIDLNTEGVYFIRYTVSDEAGNTITADRKLTINASGVSDDVVHVLLESINAAKLRLEEFYNDVLVSNLSVQQVCDKYIGDVPFPINNSDVSGCNEGLQEVRSQYTSVVVQSVVATNYEGHNVYEATVEVTIANEDPYTGTVVFAFLTKETLNEEYIHFYGDPFAHDSGGNNISVETAQLQLEMFYNSFFDDSFNTALFCNTYLMGMMPLQDCEAYLVHARDMVDSLSVENVVETEVTFPDNTQGNGFLAYVEITVDGNLIGFDLYFFFVENPTTGEIVVLVPLNDPLGNELLPDIGYIVVPQSEARNYLEAFYEELLDDSIAFELVCAEYIANSTILGPSQEECESMLMKMRSDILSLEIDVLYQESVEIAPNVLVPGYVAEITVVTDFDEFTVMVPFFFIDVSGVPYPIFTEGPLGKEHGESIELVQIPEPEALALLDEFYLMIEDPYYDLSMFCQEYFNALMLPVDPFEIQNCTDSLQYFRNVLLSHVIYEVSPTYIEADFASGNGFNAQVELHLPDNEIRNITVMFGFVEFNGAYHIVIISDPMGENHHPIDTIKLPLPEAEATIEEFYNWLMGEGTAVEEVCSYYLSYLPFEGPNYDECLDVIYGMRSNVMNLNVMNVFEGNLDTGDMMMEVYYVSISFDDLYNSESVMVDIPFVFIDYMGDARVVLMGHPLGYEDHGGEYMNLVPMPSSEVILAIDQFYQIIEDDGLDLYVFCDMYMSALPFPYSPEEVQNCADGLMNMRMGLQSHMIQNVYETYVQWDGVEGTAYEVEVQLIDFNNQVHDIMVIVGFVETPEGPAFIMLSNPGGHQDRMYLLDVGDLDAEFELYMLLDQLFYSNQAVGIICADYLLYLPTNMSPYMCENEWNELKNIFIDFTIVSISNEPYFDDMFEGIVYIAEVDYVDNTTNTVKTYIRFGFVETPDGPKLFIFGSLFGEEPPRDYNVIPYSLSDAHTLLEYMYFALLDNTVDVTVFCSEYVNNDPYGPSLQECVDAISVIRQDYVLFIIDGLVEEMIPLGPDNGVPGFQAFITLDGPLGPTPINVYFIVTDNNLDGVEEFIFMSHPAGENDGLSFITLPLEEVEMNINVFYGELLDPNVDPSYICDMYILHSPFTQFDPVSCYEFVLNVQQMGLFYNVDGVQYQMMQLPDGQQADAYVASITITFDGNVSHSFDSFFGFAAVPNGYQIIFFSENFIEGQPGQSQYADLTLMDAQNWVVQFYDALTGNAVDPLLFCQVYLTLEDSMQPMDPIDCEALKSMYEESGYSFLVSDGMFFEGYDNSPPYFVFPVTRTFNNESVTYNASFIFLIDQNGQVLLATPFYYSLGVHAGPALQFTTQSYAEANAYILEMYDMVFDTTIDAQVVCNVYASVTPIDMNAFCEDIGYFRHLDIPNTYVIQGVAEFYFEGIQYYKVFIDEYHDDGSASSFEVDFTFVINNNNEIVAVPMGPLVVFPEVTAIEDLNIANTMILEYYADLFDVSISDYDFCMEHHLSNPFFIGTETDCINGRQYALSRSETYTVQAATVYGYDPYMIFESQVFISDANGSIIEIMEFSIIPVNGVNYLLLLSELIHDIPLP